MTQTPSRPALALLVGLAGNVYRFLLIHLVRRSDPQMLGDSSTAADVSALPHPYGLDVPPVRIHPLIRCKATGGPL